MRAHFVAGGEKEQIEEHNLDEGMDLDGELAYEHAREQRADDITEFESSDSQTPQQKSECECQEDCELRIVSQRCDKIGDHTVLS